MKKVLHIVFVLLLVLAVPLSHMARPVPAKSNVKSNKATKSSKESSKAFLQPQVVHAQAPQAHALTPVLLDHLRFEITFPQEVCIPSASVTLLDKGTSEFFKILFRHVIATQAP